VSKKFLLQPGDYVISPTTFYPNKCCPFFLRAYSQGDSIIELKELGTSGVVSLEKVCVWRSPKFNYMQIAGGNAKLGGAEVVRSGKAMVNQNSPVKLPSVNTSPTRATSKSNTLWILFTSLQMLLV
jgi:hypothetical protein